MGIENMEPTGQTKVDVPFIAAVARRRISFKGIGKDAAVLAATVQLQALATPSLLTFACSC